MLLILSGDRLDIFLDFSLAFVNSLQVIDLMDDAMVDVDDFLSFSLARVRGGIASHRFKDRQHQLIDGIFDIIDRRRRRRRRRRRSRSNYDIIVVLLVIRVTVIMLLVTVILPRQREW